MDSAGDVFPYATVTFNDTATGQQTTEPIYVQSSGGNPINQPLFTDPAVIDIWTDNPIRLQIVAVVQGNVRIQLDGMDLLPEPVSIMQTPSPVQITQPPTAAQGTNAILMSSQPGEAAFRIANPLATHQHEGDSAGSVVLTGEAPTDFDPYQTWTGFHAGENTAANSAASSALGPHADVQGANATIAGIGQILRQASGLTGDMATVLSSEDGTAAQGSTTIGAANISAQGVNATVVGSLNQTTSTASTPDGTVVIGQGSVLGAAGAVKIGPNHPASTAGPNNTIIGNGNIAQNSGLPWAGAQVPTAVGTNTTLAGDPSTALSTDDWFGGVGPLALGVNSTSFNPSLTTLSGTALTQQLLSVGGDVVVNGQRTYQNTTTTLGYFGAAGTARPKIPYAAGDVVNSQVTSLCQALAKIGLIYTTDVPVVTESGTHTDGAQLEFAETGQALQWKLPPASPAYRAANPFTVASNKVVLNAANGPYPTRGQSALYSSGLSDVSVQGRFTYNPTGTNLCTNPSFETNTSGWVNWDNASVTRDPAQALWGDASGKIVTSSTTNGYSRVAYQMLGLTAGTTYNFSCWVKPATTANRNIKISMETSGTGGYLGVDAFSETTAQNGWTRVSCSGTTRTNTISAYFVVGYHTNTGAIPTTDFVWIDGAQITNGSALLPYVGTTGYHPDDLDTGLMVRTYNAQSVVGGNTQAVVTGYLIGRTSVYSMTDNTIGSTVATLGVNPATGDLLQADCVGTAVTVRVNGTSAATFTDSTLNTRVKHGFRVCPSTSAYGFQTFPSGF
jgi:hypothetical protein